jgi:hypothetical protein
VNAHLASSRGLELDHAIRHRRWMRSDQFNECRLGRLLLRIQSDFAIQISRPRRLIELSKAILNPSRTLAEKSPLVDW